MMRTFLVLTILGCAGTGCGSGSSTSTASKELGDASADGAAAVEADASQDSARDSPATVDASSAAGFCADFLLALADFLVRCEGASPVSAQGVYTDPVVCERFQSSVASGRTRFDPSGAAACLTTIQGATPCEGSSTQTSACTGAITPLVPRGGACQSFYLINLSNECMGDDFCSLASIDACVGTCAARSPAGAPCAGPTPDVRCATNTSCDFSTKVCTAVPPPVGLAQPCGGAGQGTCGPGLYCDGSASEGGASGVCQNKKSSGACTTSTECARPAHCAGASGAKSCLPVTPVGASCTAGWGECGLYSACQNGRCTDVPASVGQPCGSAGGEVITCAAGAYCDSMSLGSGVCRAQKQPGDACSGMPVLGECAGNDGHCSSTAQTCVSCPP
jgi:hypothetical protein